MAVLQPYTTLGACRSPSATPSAATARCGIMTGACRSCSGGRARKAMSSRCRSRRSTSRRRSPRLSASTPPEVDGRCLDLDRTPRRPAADQSIAARLAARRRAAARLWRRPPGRSRSRCRAAAARAARHRARPARRFRRARRAGRRPAPPAAASGSVPANSIVRRHRSRRQARPAAQTPRTVTRGVSSPGRHSSSP